MNDVPSGLRTDAFDFDLPQELIAQQPVSPRDAARLLEVGPALHDRSIRDLPELLAPGDVMVVNDTRVIPARLDGRRGDAKVEVTLHKAEGDGLWRAFAKPGRRLRVGDTITFGPDFHAEVTDKTEDGDVLLRFENAQGLSDALKRHGRMPLPPYIKRPVGAVPADASDYQTLFAERDGAVAAPTAGLHFTPALLAAIADRGIGIVRLTLHVGAGTFLPVRSEFVADHKMHSETGIVSADAAETINAARAGGGRVVAVGTTPLRLLESAADAAGRVRPFEGDTDLFITPGYRFKAVDLLLTNFHLPRSTLFMLVAAFAGLERMKRAYAHAIAERYRFFSYGDATLLHPESAA